MSLTLPSVTNVCILDLRGIAFIAASSCRKWTKVLITDALLSNRTQYVKLGNAESSFLQIVCGVPQESTLGPLLFLLYINDLANSSDVLSFRLFADDANIFHAPQKPAIHNINILNIERKTSIKYLGIYLDNHLNWKTQIAHVQGKLTKNLGVLNQLRNYLDLKMLRQLYYALIYPYLNYGAMCWGNNYQTNLNKICTKQNKCIRSIFFCKQTGAFFTILSNP